MHGQKTLPRIAVVTGASRGIGREIARRLAREGWLVVTAQRTELSLNDGVKRVVVDLNDLRPGGSVDNFIAYLFDVLPHIDMLVNNAGICPAMEECDKDVTNATELLRLTEIFNVNFYAVVHLTTALLPLLRKAPSGAARVVSISSGDGELVFFRDDIRQELERLGCTCGSSVELWKGIRLLVERIVTSEEWTCGKFASRREMIYGGQEMYRLSKASLNAFVRMAARNLAQGNENENDAFVGFVAVCPGDVATDMLDTQAEDAITVSTAVQCMFSELVLVRNYIFTTNGFFMRYGKRITW